MEHPGIRAGGQCRGRRRLGRLGVDRHRARIGSLADIAGGIGCRHRELVGVVRQCRGGDAVAAVIRGRRPGERRRACRAVKLHGGTRLGDAGQDKDFVRRDAIEMGSAGIVSVDHDRRAGSVRRGDIDGDHQRRGRCACSETRRGRLYCQAMGAFIESLIDGDGIAAGSAGGSRAQHRGPVGVVKRNDRIGDGGPGNRGRCQVGEIVGSGNARIRSRCETRDARRNCRIHIAPLTN